MQMMDGLPGGFAAVDADIVTVGMVALIEQGFDRIDGLQEETGVT